MSDMVAICQGVDNIKEVLNVSFQHIFINDDVREVKIKCVREKTLSIFPGEFFYDMYDQEVKRRYHVDEYELYSYITSSKVYDSIEEIAEHIHSLGGFEYDKSRIDYLMEQQ